MAQASKGFSLEKLVPSAFTGGEVDPLAIKKE